MTEVIFTFQGGLGGLITGLALTLWVGIGAQLYPPTADKTLPLSLTTVGCNKTVDLNSTTASPWTSPASLTPQPELVFFFTKQKPACKTILFFSSFFLQQCFFLLEIKVRQKIIQALKTNLKYVIHH